MNPSPPQQDVKKYLCYNKRNVAPPQLLEGNRNFEGVGGCIPPNPFKIPHISH